MEKLLYKKVEFFSSSAFFIFLKILGTEDAISRLTTQLFKKFQHLLALEASNNGLEHCLHISLKISLSTFPKN